MTTDIAPLSTLAFNVALILGRDVAQVFEELRVQLAGETIIADHLGLPSVGVSVFRRVIEDAQRARHALDERRARIARGNARQKAERARREQANPVPKGIRLMVPEGVTPAQAMVALDGGAQFDGADYRPIPGKLDWVFGNPEAQGGTFGPPPRPRRTRPK